MVFGTVISAFKLIVLSRRPTLVLEPPLAWLVEPAARSVSASRVLALPLPIRHASPALPANMALPDQHALTAPPACTLPKQPARAALAALRVPTQLQVAPLASTVKLASSAALERQPARTAKLANFQLQERLFALDANP